MRQFTTIYDRFVVVLFCRLFWISPIEQFEVVNLVASHFNIAKTCATEGLLQDQQVEDVDLEQLADLVRDPWDPSKAHGGEVKF